jgi:hypothetical protein
MDPEERINRPRRMAISQRGGAMDIGFASVQSIRSIEAASA